MAATPERPFIVTNGTSQEGPCLAVAQRTETVYVDNTGDNTVSVIDGATCNGKITSCCDQAPPTVQVGGNPAGLAIDHDDDTVYVDDNGFGPVSLSDFQPPSAAWPQDAPAHLGVLGRAPQRRLVSDRAASGR
jgi:DNA-binding beta-propeller fold protein YncE